MTRNTARSRDDVFEKIKSLFSDAEIVELTLMSAFFNLFNRITDSLGIPLESSDKVDLIKRSAHLDPQKLERYLCRLCDEWPEVAPVPVSD